MLGELPNLKRMTLDISGVERNDLRQLFEICTRLKSLDIRACELNQPAVTLNVNFIRNRHCRWEVSAHKSTYDLEELSISSSCGIGISDILSRCPRLRVLRIYDQRHRGCGEEETVKDLVKSLETKGCMPNLQHLDVCIYRAKKDTMSKVLERARCLRKFNCASRNLSIPDFRPHFSTVTCIHVQDGKPEFWQEVMSSCPALLDAWSVVLFAEDLIRGKKWACTGLESLDLQVFVRSEGNVKSSREAQEEALFQRIAELVNLMDLSVVTGWREEKTLRAESWGVLLGMKSLKSVTLGEELTASRDMPNVLRRFSEKQVEMNWMKSTAFTLSD